MPWWGWLIAGCVGFIGLLWASVVVFAVRNVRKLALDEDREKLLTNLKARSTQRWDWR
jgi:hypothetical protein